MNKLHSQLKIVFTGVVRDCEKFLPYVLHNFERFSSISEQCAFVFVENDSQDQTKKILSEWGRLKENFYLLNLDGLGELKIRTLRLELARNTYLEFIKQNQSLRDCDLLVVMDMDDIGAYQINFENFLSAINFLQSADDLAAVFANQSGVYYDMWALREPIQCPVDVLEEVMDYAFNNQVSDDEAFEKTFRLRIRSIDPKSKPVEVDSAFGGLGIYKMKFVIGNKNPYLGSKVKFLKNIDGSLSVFRLQICEHVHFHMGLRVNGKRLCIYPGLINSENSGVTFFPGAYRSMLF